MTGSISGAPAAKGAREAKRVRMRGRPTVENAAEIDQLLIDCALQQFAARGYGAATMLDIIKAAGVSKTTMYSRYPSKELIFRAIVSRQAERFAAAVPLNVHDNTLSLEEGLKRFANYLLKTILEGVSLEVHRLLYSESRRFPELGVAGVERNKLGIARIADFIRACAKREKIPCRNANAPAEMFLLILNGWFTNMMLSGQKASEAQRIGFVEIAVTTFLAGRSGW